MIDYFVAFIITVCIALLVVFVTAMVNMSWQKDCETVGYSRVGDKVYTCPLKK